MPGIGSGTSASDGDGNASDSSAGDTTGDVFESFSLSARGGGVGVDMAVVGGKVRGRLQHHCAVRLRARRARYDAHAGFTC